MDENSIPVLKPSHHKPVKFVLNGGRNIKAIYFALATTGFIGQNAEICQIAARAEDEEDTWCICVLPEGNFVPYATSYNGFTTNIGSDGVKRLLKDGVEVKTCSLVDALEGFVTYVTEKAKSSECIITLVGWNSQQFHVPLLLQALKKSSLSYKALESDGICYSDPYHMIRKTKDSFPQLMQASSLKLPDVHQYLNQNGSTTATVDAHRSVQMLQFVMSSLEMNMEQLKTCSFTLTSAERVRRFQRKVKRNLESMKGKLNKQGGISTSMLKKIAESGIKYRDLQRVYRKGGRASLEKLLSAPLPQKGVSDRRKLKPRVTKSKTVIDEIIKIIEKH